MTGPSAENPTENDPVLLAKDPRYGAIFHPYAGRRGDEVKANGIRFVHYTTAESAIKILRSQTAWMRSSTTMNDYMEVRYGFDCLAQAYEAHRDELHKALEFRPGAAGMLEEALNRWMPEVRDGGTFVLSVSEHPRHEDELGRLSMWRAYGGTAGVALVLNPGVFFGSSNALGAYSSPVAYLGPDAYSQELSQLVAGLHRERDFLSQMPTKTLSSAVFVSLLFSVLCTKHPGFKEELEWRVTFVPSLRGDDTPIEIEVETIRGIPQQVAKLPLRDLPERGLTGLAPATLVDRIIIGPTQYPDAQARAFIQVLSEIGIADPASKITISHIPLRTT